MNFTPSIRTTDGGPHWEPLPTREHCVRFCEIMHGMDERYSALNVDALDAWQRRKTRRGRTGLLYGLADVSSPHPRQLRQVIAFSYKTPPGETAPPVENLSVDILGVAVDDRHTGEFTQHEVHRWFGHFVRLLIDWAGYDNPLVAMRPDSMTFKPMQRMHDCIPEHVTVPMETGGGQHAVFIVDREQNRGDAVFWHLRILPCDAEGNLRGGD